jgi:hypothetical protein
VKLTPTEYDLLDTLVWVEPIRKTLLRASRRSLAARMRTKGLLSKRAWSKGYVVATALGKRSYSYGKR